MALYSGLGEAPVTRGGPRKGQSVLSATKSTGGTASNTISTPFRTVDSVQLTLNTGSAPGVGTSTLTWTVTGNVVTVFQWKPTSSANPTLIASTDTVNFSYSITGRL